MVTFFSKIKLNAQIKNNHEDNNHVLDIFPHEIWKTIFSNLSKLDLARSARACKFFNYLAKDKTILNNAPDPIRNYARHLANKIPTAEVAYIDSIVALIATENYLFASSSNGSQIIWDIKTNQITKNKEKQIKFAIPFINDSIIYSKYRNDNFYIYNLATKEKQIMKGHEQTVSCAIPLSDETVLSGSFDGNIILWEIKGSTIVNKIRTNKTIYCLALLSKEIVISGHSEGEVNLWNLKTGQCLNTFKDHWLGIDSIAILPNNNFLSFSNHTIIIRNLDSNNVITLDRSVGAYTILPNGNIATSCEGYERYIKASSEKYSTHIWDVNTGELIKSLPTVYPCKALMNLPKNLLASVETFGDIKIWDLNTGECLNTLHSNSAIKLDIMKFGEIVSGDCSGNVKIWEFPWLEDISQSPQLR